METEYIHRGIVGLRSYLQSVKGLKKEQIEIVFSYLELLEKDVRGISKKMEEKQSAILARDSMIRRLNYPSIYVVIIYNIKLVYYKLRDFFLLLWRKYMKALTTQWQDVFQKYFSK